jgi:AcrR family transcriptional regulator
VPRSEAENQRVRDEQRARILDGARAVFARRGMAATMAEVAEAAGISQGLAYRYFASKDELYRALVLEGLTSDEDPRLPTSGTPGERLERLLTVLLEARRDRPELFQLMYHVMSDPGTPPDMLAPVRARGMRFVELLRQLIVDGQATGEVARDDPGQLVVAILAALDGLTRVAFERPEMRPHFPEPRIVLRMLAP